MAKGWIGVDLDGSLARHGTWKGFDHIGTPIPLMVARVKGWLKAGKKVKIFTARANDKRAIPPIKKWCKKHLGEELEVTNVKTPDCKQIWDDRAVSLRNNTGEVIGGALQAKDREKAARETATLSELRQAGRLRRLRRIKDPTDGQKATGNYKKIHTRMHGLPISIENVMGAERSGTGGNGVKWTSRLTAHYGYFKGTRGADGDHVDCFIHENAEEKDTVYVVDQRGKDGKFDEHKVLLGFDSAEAAKQGYLSNYEKGWSGMMAITPVAIKDFKDWLKSDDTRKPFKEWAAAKHRPETEGPVTSTTRTEKAASLSKLLSLAAGRVASGAQVAGTAARSAAQTAGSAARTGAQVAGTAGRAGAQAAGTAAKATGRGAAVGARATGRGARRAAGIPKGEPITAHPIRNAWGAMTLGGIPGAKLLTAGTLGTAGGLGIHSAVKSTRRLNTALQEHGVDPVNPVAAMWGAYKPDMLRANPEPLNDRIRNAAVRQIVVPSAVSGALDTEGRHPAWAALAKRNPLGVALDAARPAAADVVRPINVPEKVDSIVARFKGGSALELVAQVKTPTGEAIKIALANTPRTRERGLAGVDHLPADQGMMFDIPGPFWMRGTKVALDIAFLTKSGTVLDVQTMPCPKPRLPHLLPKYASSAPGAVYALELAEGVAKTAGIEPGVQLHIEPISD